MISTYADNLVTSIIAFFLPIFLNNYNADLCKKILLGDANPDM